MSPGKMAAQAGHAFTETLHDARSNWHIDSDEHQQYLRYIDERPGTKVVLVAPDESFLRAIWQQAEKFIPTGPVIDSGHVMLPHFTGKPILTAVGFGPCTREQAAPFLGRLALVP